MKKLPVKFKIGWKEWTVIGIFVVILFASFSYALLRRVNNFFDSHVIQFNKVVRVELKKPIEIKEREVEVKEIVKVIDNIPHPDDLETDAEKYIYEVFGIEDYKIAIAIAKSESGLRPDAINAYNTNGTVDIGIFQINSVHFSKDECSLEKVVTIKGNVDCAYSLYQASGWNPWVVFQNGSFKNKLE